jgi:hypothetical protein
MAHTLCEHCGEPVSMLRPGPTPRTCGLPRCKTRARRHLPYVGRFWTDDDGTKRFSFRKGWTPLHPVDEPEVFGVCAAYDCHEPLTRRGQSFCSTRCRVTAHRRGVTQAGMERRRARREELRIAKIRAATLANDAIDRCRQCDDDGRRRDDSLCEH